MNHPDRSFLKLPTVQQKLEGHYLINAVHCKPVEIYNDSVDHIDSKTSRINLENGSQNELAIPCKYFIYHDKFIGMLSQFERWIKLITKQNGMNEKLEVSVADFTKTSQSPGAKFILLWRARLGLAYTKLLFLLVPSDKNHFLTVQM